MEVSPFPFQGPLEADEVSGRDELVTELVDRVTSRRVTALLGPRRYGKTSVLRRVAAELTEVSTVWVDLYEVTSMADVVVRLDDALNAATGTLATAYRQVAASLALNLGFVRVELSKPPRSRPDPAVLLSALLQVLVRTAVRRPSLLIVDEFSSISRVDGAAGALRTALQHHYRDLGIVFAGSHPSMMRTLFTSRPEPFYAQADLVEIGRLPLAVVVDLIAAGFGGTGREAGSAGGLIADFAGGHPQRTMQLADACWRHTPEGGTLDDTGWTAALDEVRRSAEDGLERLYSSFPEGQRDVLRAVARSGRVYGREADLLALSTGSATHARKALLDSGDLVAVEDGHAVVDPLLADWLRRRFPI